MRSKAVLVPALVCASMLSSSQVWAGPPFLTDDPEPVELKHWEFYAAAQWSAEQQDSELLFPSTVGNFRSPTVLNKPFAEVALDLNLPAFTQRGMRRTYKTSPALRRWTAW